MEIPLDVDVQCTDENCGKSMYVIVNPITDKVTHIVVKEGLTSGSERLVPVDYVIDSNADLIKLRCSKSELENMEPFVQKTYIREEAPERIYEAGFPQGSYTYGIGAYYTLPYVTPEYVGPDNTVYQQVKEEQVPKDELAVQRGARVQATDGTVGHVDEFVVDPENSHITHMVMREGHLWGKKEVIIPFSAIEDSVEDTVYLKLNKKQVEALPTFPLHRRWK